MVEEETAHVEFLIDPTNGDLACYLLSAHAIEPVRTTRETLRLWFESEGEPVLVELAAHANSLSGETVGDTSEFRVAHEMFAGAGPWKGRIEEIDLRGKTYKDVEFEFQKEMSDEDA